MCVIAQDTNFYRSGYCTLYKILDWKDISDGWFHCACLPIHLTVGISFCYFRGCIGTRVRPCWAFFSQGLWCFQARSLNTLFLAIFLGVQLFHFQVCYFFFFLFEDFNEEIIQIQIVVNKAVFCMIKIKTNF